MSVFAVRAFVRLRQMAGANKEMAAKLAGLERKIGSHDDPRHLRGDPKAHDTAANKEALDRLSREGAPRSLLCGEPSEEKMKQFIDTLHAQQAEAATRDAANLKELGYAG